MLRGDTYLHTAHRARGYFSESRFFYLANQPPAPRSRAPRGFVRLEQAPPIMDVRGVDGFVVHYRGTYVTSPLKIPIQLKHGPESRSSYHQTRCGMLIPVIGTRPDMTQGNVFERIRLLLDAHERTPRFYSPQKLYEIEHNRPTNAERAVMELIEQSRNAFSYAPDKDIDRIIETLGVPPQV